MADVNRGNRPLSPHLTIYRFAMTMAMSIVHRITGVGLYIGTLLLAWWLAAAASGPDYFDFVNRILGSWPGLVILFGFSWALVHHMLGGIRHLIWDTGTGFEPKERQFLAIATLVGSLTLSAIVWTLAYMLRG